MRGGGTRRACSPRRARDGGDVIGGGRSAPRPGSSCGGGPGPSMGALRPRRLGDRYRRAAGRGEAGRVLLGSAQRYAFSTALSLSRAPRKRGERAERFVGTIPRSLGARTDAAAARSSRRLSVQMTSSASRGRADLRGHGWLRDSGCAQHTHALSFSACFLYTPDIFKAVSKVCRLAPHLQQRTCVSGVCCAVTCCSS